MNPEDRDAVINPFAKAIEEAVIEAVGGTVGAFVDTMKRV
jgi:hypothetical protein